MQEKASKTFTTEFHGLNLFMLEFLKYTKKNLENKENLIIITDE